MEGTVITLDLKKKCNKQNYTEKDDNYISKEKFTTAFNKEKGNSN